ncbi:MAG TPA: hypothetical protein DCY51_02210 [Bacteroidetes bacterium]|nr:hypothetical protein [Bacteroidota bacterium]|tara:strand:+ start:370 stop:591 length:222 start_codon:yes stop_codon:yes gene_type:complete
MELSAGTKMKKYTEYVSEEMTKPKVSYNKARKWVFHKIEKTDHTHDRMKKDYHKEFGKHNAHHFDKAVSEYMD